MFDGFTHERIDVGDVTLRVRHGGAGPAVVLLHGHPRTHTTWYAVAPRLAAHHTVVCPDLRGYGESDKPRTTADHEPYSKRAMARDIANLMTRLGHERFAVVGHDRGAYVALRAALDHPDRVTHLAILDAVPIGEALRRCDVRFAQAWWHWFFFGQTAKPAERIISADPDAWYTATEQQLGKENFADYHRAIHDPATVHAMVEDYRAGLGIDRAHDDADRAAGRALHCPCLVLWATGDDLHELYEDVLEVWRLWASDLRGGPIDSGHHMAEDNPDDLARELTAFLS
jgi:haloacetate dehalogenase